MDAIGPETFSDSGERVADASFGYVSLFPESHKSEVWLSSSSSSLTLGFTGPSQSGSGFGPQGNGSWFVVCATRSGVGSVVGLKPGVARATAGLRLCDAFGVGGKRYLVGIVVRGGIVDLGRAWIVDRGAWSVERGA
jgi:hypothetical protein